MFSKTLFITGAAFGLLSFVTPVLDSHASEPAAQDPLLSVQSPAVEHLTLQAAFDRARQFSPELIAYSEESQARAAEITQAGRLFNPELSVEVANVAGSGAFSGFDAAETTWQLSQQLELGGKRQLRRGLAEMEHARSLHDLEMARIAVQAQVARHFWAMLAAQEHLELADEQIVLAAETLAAVEEKITAGKAPVVEKYRFQAALAEARLVKEMAALRLATTRQTLAGNLGLEAPALGGVSGDLTILPTLPAYSEIEAQLEQSPEVVRQQLESDLRRRSLDLAQANRFGDPTLALGLRNFNDSDDSALLFGLSLPLPLFDRNQGNVQAASRRLAAAQAQEANGRLQGRAGLAESWQSLAASCAEAQMLRAEIIPFAQQTYAAASYGYQSGKFAMLEMLEAQQTLMEVRERYLDVLTSAQLAAVELDRLLGRVLVSTSDPSTKECALSD